MPQFAGVARPISGEGGKLAEEHRALISRWFYDCKPAMHAQMTRLYVDDPRFAEHYERRATGLAAYVHEAAVANSRSSG